MRLTKVKDTSQLGVFKDMVDIQVVDGNIEAVVIKKDGQELRIASAGSYSDKLNLFLPEPQEEVIRYRLEGKFMGLSIVPQEFDQEYDANRKMNDYLNKASFDDDTELAVVPFKVYVDSTKI